MNHIAISASTLEGITGLVSAIGTPQFSHSLFGFFNKLVAIDHCSVFMVEDHREPKTLFAEGLNADRCRMALALAKDYVDGEFINDPVLADSSLSQKLHACGRPIVTAFHPHSLPATDYRRHFYDVPAITHEVNIVGEVDDTRFYASLYRTTQPLFTPTEVSSVNFYATVAINAMRRHVALTPLDTVPISRLDAMDISHRPRMLAEIREDLKRTGVLSPREAEVCAHIVLGYTNAAISLHLGITPNTASTHRKRAYAKLGISSQSELFARYVDYARDIRH